MSFSFPSNETFRARNGSRAMSRRASSGICCVQRQPLSQVQQPCLVNGKTANPANGSHALDGSDPSRRSVLFSSLATGAALLQGTAMPQPAAADVVKDALRGFTRPDVGVEDALVILLDAKSTLKEIQAIAATPVDSQERFQARAFWPSYAKRLRAVAEAAPVVAGVVTGAADKEETLGELYGGKAQGAGVADAVYQGLGQVLTISGRTIRPEAQASPWAALGAEAAIDGFLSKVPAPLLEAAQQFRVARARATGLLK